MTQPQAYSYAPLAPAEKLKQDLAQFDTLLADITVAMKPVLEMKVIDSDSEAKGLSAAGQIQTLLKRIDTREKELIVPLKAQADSIKAAANKVRAALDPHDKYVRGQLDAYAAELARMRAENLRLQRDKEEAERKAAQAKRDQEAAELKAKQEAERLEKALVQKAEREAREAAAAAEQLRIAQEAEAKAKASEEQARRRSEAARLFGTGGGASFANRIDEERAAADAKVAEAQRIAKEKADAEQKAADERAAAEAKALADQQERDRIAEQARAQREEYERAKAAAAKVKEIEEQRMKGSKMDLEITVVDAWAIPREFVKDPEAKINELKKSYKANPREIPGVSIREFTKVSVRAESVPTAGALA